MAIIEKTGVEVNYASTEPHNLQQKLAMTFRILEVLREHFRSPIVDIDGGKWNIGVDFRDQENGIYVVYARLHWIRHLQAASA